MTPIERGGAGAVSQATPDSPLTNAPNGTKAREGYQLFDLLSSDEYDALKADIARRGVLVPVEYDEHGVLLDGHHRVRACDELAITDYARITRVGLSNAEKEEHVVTLNLRRRHLNGEQKRRWISWFLERHPEWSDRRIAAEVGVDGKTVATVREDDGAEIPHRVGRDGVAQPTKKPSVISNSEKGQKKAEAAARKAAEKGRELPTSALLSPDDATKAATGPHVGHNSGENEWYTPKEFIESARLVLGVIDLDPASSARANDVVQATRFYSIEDDGLTQDWQGRAWMNPPYASGLIERFCSKMASHWVSGSISAAIVLVNNATETQWFQGLAHVSSAMCFPERRIRFWNPDGEPGAPLQGQAVIYLGADVSAFVEEFAQYGLIVEVRS